MVTKPELLITSDDHYTKDDYQHRFVLSDPVTTGGSLTRGSYL